MGLAQQRGRDKANTIQTTSQSKRNVMNDHTSLPLGWAASEDDPLPSQSKDDPLQPSKDALAAFCDDLAGSVEGNSPGLASDDDISMEPPSLLNDFGNDVVTCC